MEQVKNTEKSYKLSSLTRGEIEMQELAQNPVAKFRQLWPLMKTRTGWLEDWLQRQHTGEVNALASMEILLDSVKEQASDVERIQFVERIISDEKRHVAMIKELLLDRGVAPRLIDEPETLAGMDSWADGCALASRAEAVRSGKARVLVEDQDVPGDVREVFSRILRDEAFHEHAFRFLAGEEKMLQNPQFREWTEILGIEAIPAAEHPVLILNH